MSIGMDSDLERSLSYPAQQLKDAIRTSEKSLENIRVYWNQLFQLYHYGEAEHDEHVQHNSSNETNDELDNVNETMIFADRESETFQLYILQSVGLCQSEIKYAMGALYQEAFKRLTLETIALIKRLIKGLELDGWWELYFWFGKSIVGSTRALRVMVGLVAQCIKKNRAEEERRERSEESSEEENDDENSIVSVRPQEKTRTIEQLFQHLDAARSERKAKRGRSRNFEIFAPADVVKAEEMLGVKMMNRGRGKSDEEERFKECEGKGEDKGEVEEDQEDEEVDMVVNGDIIEEAENTTQISGDASKRHSYDDLEPEVSRRARKDLDNFDDSFVDPDLILEDAEKTEDISGRNVSKGRRKAQLFHLYDVDVGNDDDDDQRVFLGGEGSEIMNGNDETENISTLMSFASVERGGLLDPIHNPMEDSQDNISFVLDTTPKRYPEEMKYQEKIMEQSERVDFIAQREREEIVTGQKGHEQRQIGLFKTSRVTNTPFLTSARPTATEYITPRPSTSAYTLIGNIIEIPDDSDTEDNKPSGQSSPDIRSILKIIESAERWTDEVLYTVLCSLDHSSSIRILDPLSISLSSSNRQQGIRKYMEYETIIAPIHHKGVAPYWTLVIMRPREHRFEFWDSLEE